MLPSKLSDLSNSHPGVVSCQNNWLEPFVGSSDDLDDLVLGKKSPESLLFRIKQTALWIGWERAGFHQLPIHSETEKSA